MTPDILARLDAVVTRLDGVGVAAAIDPAQVNVPGAWVEFTGIDGYVLSSDAYVQLNVVVIVPANGLRDDLAALQTLLDTVVEELGVPDGDVRKQSTVLPDVPTPRPSLVLPYLI